MRGEKLLDVSRGELLTTTIDAIFDSAGDRDESVIVENADISGPEPAGVVECDAVGRGLEVAEHPLGPPHRELARATRWQRVTVIAENSNLDPGCHGAVRRRAQIERIRWAHHRHGRQLGHAVYPCRGDTLLLTALHHGTRHRGSPTGKHSQRQPDPSISRSVG